MERAIPDVLNVDIVDKAMFFLCLHLDSVDADIGD